jgi:hypothetical protein
MRIVEQTPDRLVLHESPWGLRAMGALFTLLGAGTVFLVATGGRSTQHNSWVAFVVGGAFVMVGVVAAVAAADCRVVFDRAARSVQAVRRGLFGVTTTDYPFSSIRDVALEMPAPVGRGSTNGMYRIVFVLRDGTRVPWTSTSTGDIGTQAQCVAAARAMGGWDAPVAGSMSRTPVPTPVGVGAVAERRLTPLATVPVADSGVAPRSDNGSVQNIKLVGCFLGIFAVIGAAMLAVEVDHFLTWRPVSAVVLNSTVTAVHGSKGGVSYRPVVTYEYAVGGRPYRSSNVHVLTVSMGYDWAVGVSAHYVPGTTTTAYVDPSDPEHAFLVHRISMVPLIFILVPIVFGGILRYISNWNTRQTALAASVQVPVVSGDVRTPPRAA